MPLSKSQLQRINDCLDMMSKRLDEAQERRIREDADDRQLEEDMREGNTMPIPAQPFSDGAPEKIHGQPDQELWPPKPRVPVPIETL
jgi:hypothetical protein